jgi:hypothetical protein
MSDFYPGNDQPTYVPQQTPPPPPTGYYTPPVPPQKKPWYKTNGGIILLLVLFFPAGLFLMWSYANWPKNAKWIVTAIIAVIGIISIATNNSKPTQSVAGAPTQQTQSVAHVATTPTATPIPKPTPTPTAIPTPTPVPTWQTTHTYTGNGIKKTETITVPGDWKLLWTCDPASSYGGSYNVIVEVDNSDGTTADPAAINTICASGNTSGDTEERQAGNVYFSVNSEAAWTLTVQELK